MDKTFNCRRHFFCNYSAMVSYLSFRLSAATRRELLKCQNLLPCLYRGKRFQYPPVVGHVRQWTETSDSGQNRNDNLSLEIANAAEQLPFFMQPKKQAFHSGEVIPCNGSRLHRLLRFVLQPRITANHFDGCQAVCRRQPALARLAGVGLRKSLRWLSGGLP